MYGKNLSRSIRSSHCNASTHMHAQVPSQTLEREREILCTRPSRVWCLEYIIELLKPTRCLDFVPRLHQATSVLNFKFRICYLEKHIKRTTASNSNSSIECYKFFLTTKQQVLIKIFHWKFSNVNVYSVMGFRPN